VNADLDKAIDDGRNGPDCSIAARKRAYDAFNRILNEDQPYNFLFWQKRVRRDVIPPARPRPRDLRSAT